jgi:predicted RNase H-like nuclease (RuvC/YqgF family)
VKELQEKVDLLTEQLKMKQKVEAIGDKLSEEHKQLLTVKEQTSVEIKQEMERKILSLSQQLRERDEEVKQLSTDIKVNYVKIV